MQTVLGFWKNACFRAVTPLIQGLEIILNPTHKNSMGFTVMILCFLQGPPSPDCGVGNPAIGSKTLDPPLSPNDFNNFLTHMSQKCVCGGGGVQFFLNLPCSLSTLVDRVGIGNQDLKNPSLVFVCNHGLEFSFLIWDLK